MAILYVIKDSGTLWNPTSVLVEKAPQQMNEYSGSPEYQVLAGTTGEWSFTFSARTRSRIRQFALYAGGYQVPSWYTLEVNNGGWTKIANVVLLPATERFATPIADYIYEGDHTGIRMIRISGSNVSEAAALCFNVSSGYSRDLSESVQIESASELDVNIMNPSLEVTFASPQDVNVVNTPSVIISGTPSVNANVTNASVPITSASAIDVNVQNSSIDVTASANLPVEVMNSALPITTATPLDVSVINEVSVNLLTPNPLPVTGEVDVNLISPDPVPVVFNATVPVEVVAPLPVPVNLTPESADAIWQDYIIKIKGAGSVVLPDGRRITPILSAPDD